jgi:hypothetical protein
LTFGGERGDITSNGEETPTTTEEIEEPAAEVEISASESSKPVESESVTEDQEEAEAATANQPGRAEGEAAIKEGEEAQKEAAAAKGEAPAASEEADGGQANTATEESEKFSEGFGITVDEAGNAVNSGGNLGITQGSDGSQSVGGGNGINISTTGEATIEGNETQ